MFIYAAMSTKPAELSVVCKWTSLIEKEINTGNVLLVYFDEMHRSKVYRLSLHLAQEGLSVLRKLCVNSLLIIDS